MTTSAIELTAEPAFPTQAQIAGARTLLDEFAQVTSHSADAEDGERIDTLYQLIEAAERRPAASPQPLKDVGLIRAAQSLIDNWKTGDLAFAIAELNSALQDTLQSSPPPIAIVIIALVDALNDCLERLQAYKQRGLSFPITEKKARAALDLIKDARTPWERNEVQFPRLLAEIMASGALGFATANESNWDALCDSMDLTSKELNELFNRAQAEWERIK